MRFFFLIFIALFPFQAFTQQFTKLVIDENISLAIPDNYSKKDTLGTTVFSARIDYGLVMIVIVPTKLEGVKVKDEKALLKTYNGFRTGLLGSSKGKMVSQETLDINGLKLDKISFTVKTDTQTVVKDCLTLLAADNIYSIQFWQVDWAIGSLAKQKDSLFSSIKINPALSSQDQFNYSSKEETFERSVKIGELIGSLLTIAIIIFFVVWLIRKLSKKKA